MEMPAEVCSVKISENKVWTRCVQTCLTAKYCIYGHTRHAEKSFEASLLEGVHGVALIVPTDIGRSHVKNAEEVRNPAPVPTL